MSFENFNKAIGNTTENIKKKPDEQTSSGGFSNFNKAVGITEPKKSSTANNSPVVTNDQKANSVAKKNISQVDYGASTNPIISAVTGGSTLKKFASDALNAIPEASKKVSSFINDWLINKPAEQLAKTNFIKGASTGIYNEQGQDTGNLGKEVLKKLSYGTESISGLTGGMFQSQTEAPTDLTDKVVSGLSSAVGTVTGLGLLSGGFSGIKTPEILSGFIEKYPTVAKYAIPLMKNAVAFSAYGQLDPKLAGNVTERLQKFGMDLATSVPYTFLGNLKSAKYSIPASFGLGYGLAKLSGASNEDAIISGSVLGMLDGFGRVGGEGKHFISGRVADLNIKVEARNVINEFSDVKITDKSTPEQIQTAFRKAARATHPDLNGGTDVNFKRVNSAYQFLNGKTTNFASVEPTENDAVVRTAPETDKAIKQYTQQLQNPEVKNDVVKTQEIQNKVTNLVVQKGNFYNDNKRMVFSISGDTPENQLSTIETSPNGDGKFVVKLQADTPSHGIQVDFSQSKIYNTEEEAIAGAKKEIQLWAEDALKRSGTPEDQTALENIINGTKHPAIIGNIPVDIRTNSPVKKDISQIKLYHGTKTIAPDSIKSKGFRIRDEVSAPHNSSGLSLSTDKDTAKIYGKKVIEITLDPKAKIISLADALQQSGLPVEESYINESEDKVINWAKKNGYDGIDLRGAKGTFYKSQSEIRIFNKDVINTEQVSTQKEQVKETVKTGAKSIKEIAQETGIKEPNVRRILGVGAKEGTFERVEEGIYVLSKDGEDLAYVETGNAVESLPRLADSGFKANMVFLDIPYDTPAVKGGNRGVKYELVSVDDFKKIIDAVKVIAKTKNSPVIHMYSQAESGLVAMKKYNDVFIEKGFKPVGKGEYQKTFADGSPVTSPNGKVSKPEGIIVFTQSGDLDKGLKNLNFTLKRPKGYQTEKPAEMLKAMIEMTTNEGDMVLDPFAGSGVTGAEAVKSGRKSYNIEKNKEVSDTITKPRIKSALEEKKPKHVLPSTKKKSIIQQLEDTKNKYGEFSTEYKDLIDKNTKPIKSPLSPKQEKMMIDNANKTNTKNPEAVPADKTFYHGTLTDFKQFSLDHAGANTGWENAKFGIFFSDSKQLAENFINDNKTDGEDRPTIVKEVTLDLKNPIDLTLKGILTKESQAPTVVKMLQGEDIKDGKKALKSLDDVIDLGTIGDLYDELYSRIENKKLLQDAGYDGIISQFGKDDNGNVIKEYVVFDPSQIKTKEVASPVESDNPVSNLESDIPLQTAIDAHRGTSFDPEKRGQQEISRYVEFMQSNYDELKKLANTPEKQATLDRMFTSFREGYKSRQVAVLNSKSRTISPMISGAGNFPVARNRKRLDSAMNKSKEMWDYSEKTLKRIESELNPSQAKQFAGTSEKTINVMDEKLKELKDLQVKMRETNKIIRSGVDVENKLKALGYDDQKIDDLQKKDFAGRIGYPDYALTSINNKIKTLERSVNLKTKKREVANTTGNQIITIGTTDIIKNFDLDRVQLLFEGKPSSDIITQLKSKGFRWSPFNKAWQRVLTNKAFFDARQIIDPTNKFANPNATSDTATIQEIRNSIQEGKMILRAGSIDGRKLSEDEKIRISQSIDNAQTKIGVEQKDGYTIEEISSDQIFSAKKDIQDTIEKITLAPSKATTDEEKSNEAKIALGDRYVMPKTLVDKTDIKKIIQNSPEFAESPILVVDENKNLTFSGEKNKFSIKASALGLNPENLMAGDEITVDVESLKVKGASQQLRAYKGGSAYANIGVFRDNTPVELGSMNTIKPIEMPELVRLAKELTGNTPKIKAKMGDKLGYFRGSGSYGNIFLKADQFQQGNEANLAKLLAHEIGHLVDWLPDKTMARGNLLGRIFSLRKFMSSTFDKTAGEALDLSKLRGQAVREVLGQRNIRYGDYITKKAIRDDVKDEIKERLNELIDESGAIRSSKVKTELMAVSSYWRPYDMAKSTATYKKYRENPKELYADAISMLLNSAGTLERMAPTFYTEFFDALDSKPEVKANYFELQELLHGNTEALFQARKEDIRKGFGKAENLQKGFAEKKKSARENIGERLRQAFDDVNYPLIKAQRKAIQDGAVIAPADNVEYTLQEELLSNNDNFLMVNDIDKNVIKPIEEAGMTVDDIGEYLLLDRIRTERKDIANPFGFNQSNAEKQLEHLQKTVGNENYQLLEAKVMEFHDIIFNSVEEAVRVGTYSAEKYDELLANKYHYSAFQVVDYLQDYVPASMKKQIGTLKEVANPAVSTILKTVSLNRLNARQRSKNSAIKGLKENYPDQISLTKKITTDGKLSIFRPANDMGSIEVFENGKLVSYDVDPYIAESFNQDKTRDLQMVANILQKPNNIFKPLVTTFNLGFSLWNNPQRDFKANYKKVGAIMDNLRRENRDVKKVTVKSLLTAYIKSLPSAYRYSKGDLDEFTRMLVETKAMTAPLNDYSYDPRNDEFGRTLEKFHITKTSNLFGLSDDNLTRKVLVEPIEKLILAFRSTLNITENISKIAGARILSEGGMVDQELAHNVRNFVGTPNYKTKGTATYITNELFPFSNIMKEGIKSDFKIGSDPKTRSGYWWRTVKIDLLPKMLMFILSATVLKEFYDNVSEYDKTNYLIIPLGWYNTNATSKGLVGINETKTGARKAVYMRIPHDEMGRLYSAVMWKIMSFAETGKTSNLQQILEIGAGQFPSLTPSVAIPSAWSSAYLMDKNPYDAFRGRTIVDDTTFMAGGLPKLDKMIQWSTNNFGITKFATFDTSKNTGAETFMQVVPWFSSVIKISDYGQKEKLMNITNEIKQEDAVRSLKDREIISKYVDKARQDKSTLFSATKYRVDIIKEVLGGHLPKTAEEKTQADNVMLKFKRSLKRGLNDDPQVDAILSATTNNQKMAIIKQIKSEMTPEEFSKFRTGLIQDNIVSATLMFSASRQ